jgi:hypothetical protein
MQQKVRRERQLKQLYFIECPKELLQIWNNNKQRRL